jgi:hypothetical protein
MRYRKKAQITIILPKIELFCDFYFIEEERAEHFGFLHDQKYSGYQ